MKRKSVAILLAMAVSASMITAGSVQAEGLEESTVNAEETEETTSAKTAEQSAIEEALNLANMEEQEWSYTSQADAWTLSGITTVTNPEIEEEQGVSVCVPGAYIIGIDTDGDGVADVTSENYSEAVKGSLVIDYDAQVTSTNGQVYSAATAPVIVNTGAAGYSEQQNQTASSTYAAEGYINVSCGNRGKQSTTTDEDGNTVYTGDAPSCLVDQKNAVRFVKYNILLGNLPGSVDTFVSTGGSGGGAHAAMLAATGDNPDLYDYEIAAGAVGVYKNEDGTYTTTVTIDGEEVELSDAMWGCMAYSAITSLAEADMAMALEYYMDTTYDFNTDFQRQMAEYLSREYMDYINGKELSVEESAVGFDDSLSLYVDTMYGIYVEGAVSIEKAAAETQTENGTAEEASGKDISGWVSYDEETGAVFSLADAAAYRTAGASKAIPGFDVMDYGQEDYVFGSSESDARHWNAYLLKVFEEHADTLSELFNK